MEFSECTTAYACAVIREILDTAPPGWALAVIDCFMSGNMTVEEALAAC